MLNKKGQSVAFAILWGLVIFMLGVLFVPFIGDEVTRTTSSAQLDCNNATISDGAKLSCLFVDATVVYFVIIIFSIIGGIVLSRLLTKK